MFPKLRLYQLLEVCRISQLGHVMRMTRDFCLNKNLACVALVQIHMLITIYR